MSSKKAQTDQKQETFNFYNINSKKIPIEENPKADKPTVLEETRRVLIKYGATTAAAISLATVLVQTTPKILESSIAKAIASDVFNLDVMQFEIRPILAEPGRAEEPSLDPKALSNSADPKKVTNRR